MEDVNKVIDNTVDSCEQGDDRPNPAGNQSQGK